jgi:malate permease and related proteins
MSSVNAQFLVNTLVIAVGWLLRRFLVDEAGSAALVRVAMNVTLPAVVITTFATARLAPSAGLLPLVAVSWGLAMAALGATALFRARPRRERGELALLLPAFNIALFAYPLVEGALGRPALAHLVVLDMGNAINSFVIQLAVARHFARPPGRGLGLGSTFRDMLKTVPFVIYLLTLALGILGLRYPEPVPAVARVLAQANMPLALLALGMYLRFDAVAGRWRDIARVLGLRYAVGLAAGSAAWLLLPLDPLARTVVVATLVLPPPVLSISYAVELGYDARFVGAAVNVANVVSFLLLWGIFSFAR